MKLNTSTVLLLLLGMASPLAFAGHGHESRGGGYGRHDTHVNISISPRYGRPYAHYGAPQIYTGIGLGFGAGWYANQFYGPYDRWDYSPARPLVIERNTIIEKRDRDVVEDEEGSGYERETPASSLLRDLQGRCYERTYERGVEHRVELDATECDF